MIFGYELAEVRKALIAVVYLGFAAAMLVFAAPKVGFENAVLAIVPPLFAAIGVFEAKNHTPDDVGKALQALWGAIASAIAYYVAIPNSTGEAITMLIAGVVMFLGVKYVPNAGRGAPGQGGTVVARGP